MAALFGLALLVWPQSAQTKSARSYVATCVARVMEARNSPWLKLSPASSQNGVPKATVKQIASATLKARGNLQKFFTLLHEQLGPVYSINLPTLPKKLYFVSDPETIKEVLLDTDRSADSAFVKSPDQLRALGKFAGDNNLFSAPMETWRPQRKQFAPEFTAKAVNRPDYAGKIDDIVKGHFAELRSSVVREGGTEAVDFKKLLHETTLDVILRLLFNYKLPPKELSELAKGMQQAYEAVLVESLNPLKRPLHQFPVITPYQARIKPWLEKTDRIIDDIIEHVEHNPSDAKGFMGLLMSMRDPVRGALSRKELHDQVLAFLFAGHETTAHTLTWAFHEITSNPRIMGKLTGLIQGGNVAAANEYIDQIWSESLRLHMPIPLIPRQATKDITLSSSAGPVHIPKGSTLVLDVGVMQRQESTWGVAKTGYPANEFHPERFSTENKKAFGMDGCEDFKNYAFGAGPRFCIGASMASVEARKIIFDFFKNFSTSEVTSGAKVKVSALNNALIEPHHMKVTVH